MDQAADATEAAEARDQLGVGMGSSAAGGDVMVVTEADVAAVMELGPEDARPEEEEVGEDVVEISEEPMGAGEGGAQDGVAIAPERDDSIASFNGHASPVYSVAVSPDGELAASGGGDDKAFLWALRSGEQLGELTGHKDSVTHVRFSGDGSMLATGAMDGEIRVWSTDGLDCLLELDCGDDLTVRATARGTVRRRGRHPCRRGQRAAPLACATRTDTLAAARPPARPPCSGWTGTRGRPFCARAAPLARCTCGTRPTATCPSSPATRTPSPTGRGCRRGAALSPCPRTAA